MVGVVSHGAGCAEPNSLGIYSKVSENIDWLYASMPDLNTCSKHSDIAAPDEANAVSCEAGPVQISINEDEFRVSSCGSCVFPFIYRGRLHDTCTNIDGDSRKWCSKVENFDDNLNEWEYCDEDDSCPGMTTSSIPQMSVDPKNEPGHCYCGVPNYPDDQDKIVGGKPIAVGVYPWQVALMYGSNLGSQGCGGTLVGDQHVITAAHCTYNLDPSRVSVRIGDTSFDSDVEVEGAVTIGVEEILNHPEYDTDTLENDISILVLEEKISLTEYPNIKPACLPEKGCTHTGKGYISGWGTVGSGGLSTSWLHGAEVNIFETEDCGRFSDSMTDDMMCAGWNQERDFVYIW